MVLVIAGLGLGSMPGLAAAIAHAAARFQDAPAYANRVLNGVSIPALAMPAANISAHVLSLSALAIAVLIALIDLFSDRTRQMVIAMSKPLKPIRMLHSGHVGDYVAFVTFGIAIFGVVCGLCLR
jgi:multicomponent Na+:H+ antiporter subunit D